MSFAGYKQNALQVFSTGTSDWVLEAGCALGVKLPDRVGGHDDNRNTTGGNQQGSSQKDSEHGINQGNQWKRYREQVEAAFQKKYKVQFDENHVKSMLGKKKGEEEEQEEEKEEKKPSKSVQRQDPTVSARAKEQKEEEKEEKKNQVEEDSDRLVQLFHSSLHWNSYKSGGKGEIRTLVERLLKAYHINVSSNDWKEPVEVIKKLGLKNSEIKKATPK